MTVRVGDYQGNELIAHGSSGTVWSGVHLRTGQQVALKVFDLDSGLDGRAQATREAALAAAVDHQNLLAVVGVAADDEHAALVTALAAGGCLADLIARRTLRCAELVSVIAPIAGVLAKAHELDVMHGDLSPGNILFDGDGTPLLADLGAARAAAEVNRPVSATPGYVAPEVARGAAPQPWSDVFSLGAVALHCLTGRPAWPADDLRDVVIQSTAGQWPDPGELDRMPREVLTLLRRMLDPDPDRRPGAAEVAVELRSLGHLHPIDLAAFGDAPDEEENEDVVELPLVRGFGAGRLPRLPRPAAADRDEPGRSGRLPGRDAVRARLRGRAAVPGAVRIEAAEPEPPRPVGSSSSAARRAHALTRLRPDTPNTVPPQVPTGSRLPGRVLVAALVITVVGAGAVLAGLWWADSDRSDPASYQAAPVASADPAVPGPGAGAGDPVEGVNGEPTTDSAAGRTPPVVDVGSEPAGPPVLGSAAEPVQLPPDGVTGVDWSAVVADLDGRRAQAFIRRSDANLRAVYTDNAAALEVDTATVQRLTDSGMTLDDARHAISAVEPVDIGSASGIVVVKVTSSLPTYPVRNGSGEVVAHTAAAGDQVRLMVLERGDSGYRIADIRPNPS